MNARATILACVRTHPLSTASFIACQTGIPGVETAAELSAMVADGLLCAVVAGATPLSPAMALYNVAAETIGTCDICGRADHHLIDDVCPQCRPKVVTVGGRSPGFYACAEDDEL